MQTYIIAYDLYAPGQNYQQIRQAIESRYKLHKQVLNTTWLVHTNESAQQILGYLQTLTTSRKSTFGLPLPILDTNDKLLVAPVGGRPATYGSTNDVITWLALRT